MRAFTLTQISVLCLACLSFFGGIQCQQPEPSFVLSKVDVSISAADVRRLSQSINYPDALSAPLTLQPNERLRVSFNLKQKTSEGEKPFRAHQAFAVFTQVGTQEQLIRKLDSTKSGKYKLLLDTKEKKTTAQKFAGEYHLDIVLGAFSIPDAINYRVGTIQFETEAAQEPQTTQPQLGFGPRPEIHHIFRKPEDLPPTWLSSLFALIVLSPWVWLVISWSSLGVNLSHFPVNAPSEMVPALGFIGTLGSIAYLYYRYWTDLNIFDTLSYLLILSVIGAVTGRKTLRDLAKRRISA
ncbi:hypothetical protein K493DRAFT_262233 [Basidiobolus meristosporus CBS 931.73]|uniref:Ribophorin II n=1 Tax=Basidiobolus meristosporus CBS 931.73 TaxID=1314790 RepID=A0A1Y1Y6E4_9FUNG|nr:hypothetical protein K493DRAFT_262233 [Basidiobolus meristosporus CBS 931.73]|eukprot:ORX93601.1 hypothetical protein K493DRAFT_262233 [Basidiobolus meristosporus CBS 931.73]